MKYESVTSFCHICERGSCIMCCLLRRKTIWHYKEEGETVDSSTTVPNEVISLKGHVMFLSDGMSTTYGLYVCNVVL